MRPALALSLLLFAALPVSAHRLDEYLQATILSVEKDRLQAQMTLTPGVAVFPFLMTLLDADANGIISETEQRAYADRVLREVSLGIDGRRLTPRLQSIHFPPAAEMKEGRGEIELNFSADLSAGGSARKLTLENHHLARISAYQVNCLVPRDTGIRITAQERNESQSLYRLLYLQPATPSPLTPFALWSGGFGWLGLIALLQLKRARPSDIKTAGSC